MNIYKKRIILLTCVGILILTYVGTLTYARWFSSLDKYEPLEMTEELTKAAVEIERALYKALEEEKGTENQEKIGDLIKKRAKVLYQAIVVELKSDEELLSELENRLKALENVHPEYKTECHLDEEEE